MVGFRFTTGANARFLDLVTDLPAGDFANGSLLKT
jgi:hypothetical protein